MVGSLDEEIGVPGVVVPSLPIPLSDKKKRIVGNRGRCNHADTVGEQVWIWTGRASVDVVLAAVSAVSQTSSCVRVPCIHVTYANDCEYKKHLLGEMHGREKGALGGRGRTPGGRRAGVGGVGLFDCVPFPFFFTNRNTIMIMYICRCSLSFWLTGGAPSSVDI